jgi:hypothetical protein
VLQNASRSALLGLLSLAVVACSDSSPAPGPTGPSPPPANGTISGSVTFGSIMLGGVTVTLSAGRTTTSGSNGGYTFADVGPGSYTLSIAVPSGFELPDGEPVEKSVTVTAGQTSTVNFSVVEILDLELGERLFDLETFGGNGRTCVTCHMKETGTLTLEAVAARLAASRNDPLFRHDGMDDGQSGTSRLVTHGTFRIAIELPPNVTLTANPSQRTVILHRGVPSTMNSPVLDGRGVTALMLDLRQPTLIAQALGAIHEHAQATIEPTFDQLIAIARFQEHDPRFFSSAQLELFAKGGSAPDLPAALTESQIRGRLFFENVQPVGKAGACAVCHSGPGLNETNQFGPTVVGLARGAKFANVGVAERNATGNPVRTYSVDNGAGLIRTVTISDPGIMLTGRAGSEHVAAFFTANRHPAELAGFFKTPTLWGVSRTPPYFHDNSAKTLRDVVDHYAQFFFPDVGIFLTEQDILDIVAFLELF